MGGIFNVNHLPIVRSRPHKIGAVRQVSRGKYRNKTLRAGGICIPNPNLGSRSRAATRNIKLLLRVRGAPKGHIPIMKLGNPNLRVITRLGMRLRNRPIRVCAQTL